MSLPKTIPPPKIPDIDACPVCGAYLVWIEKTSGRRMERTPPAAEPEAVCSHENDGSLAARQLTWRCIRCCARWVHGQFSETGADQ